MKPIHGSRESASSSFSVWDYWISASVNRPFVYAIGFPPCSSTQPSPTELQSAWTTMSKRCLLTDRSKPDMARYITFVLAFQMPHRRPYISSRQQNSMCFCNIDLIDAVCMPCMSWWWLPVFVYQIRHLYVSARVHKRLNCCGSTATSHCCIPKRNRMTDLQAMLAQCFNEICHFILTCRW